MEAAPGCRAEQVSRDAADPVYTPAMMPPPGAVARTYGPPVAPQRRRLQPGYDDDATNEVDFAMQANANAIGREKAEPTPILAPAITAGLLTFFVTDSLAGGLTGAQGFLIGTLAALAVLGLLVVLAAMTGREERHEADLEQRQRRLDLVGGLPKSGEAATPPRALLIVCPSCANELSIDAFRINALPSGSKEER